MEDSDPVEGKEEEGLAVVSLDQIRCPLQGEEDMAGVDMEAMADIDCDDASLPIIITSIKSFCF